MPAWDIAKSARRYVDGRPFPDAERSLLGFMRLAEAQSAASVAQAAADQAAVAAREPATRAAAAETFGEQHCEN